MRINRKPDARKVMTVTKVRISNTLSIVTGMKKSKAKIIIQSVTDCMIALLTDGQKVAIKGCGILSTNHKEERAGRNPKNGDYHLITARKVITFGKSKDDSEKASIPKICSIISSLANVSLEEARAAFDVFIDYLDGVSKGLCRMELRGLGVFYFSIHPAGFKRNPSTGEQVHCKERPILRFKASRLLLKSINGGSL